MFQDAHGEGAPAAGITGKAKREAKAVFKKRTQKEAEMKILLTESQLALVEKILLAEGAKEKFRGENKTWWFEHGIYKKGQSSRIKMASPLTGGSIFTATVKEDLITERPTDFLKNKSEVEADAGTFEDAQGLLVRMRKDILKTKPELGSPTLSTRKSRTSFVIKAGKKERRRGYADLEVDLDIITEVNGMEVEPIHLVEIEDTSRVSARVKERRIRELASLLGVAKQIDKDVASLSTERLLIYLGYISQKEFVVHGRPNGKHQE